MELLTQLAPLNHAPNQKVEIKGYPSSLSSFSKSQATNHEAESAGFAALAEASGATVGLMTGWILSALTRGDFLVFGSFKRPDCGTSSALGLSSMKSMVLSGRPLGSSGKFGLELGWYHLNKFLKTPELTQELPQNA